jgi:hypothetical protein
MRTLDMVEPAGQKVPEGLLGQGDPSVVVGLAHKTRCGPPGVALGPSHRRRRIPVATRRRVTPE